MKTRILVAIPIAVVLLLAMFAQGWVLQAFAVALALLAQFEVCRALGQSESRPSMIVSMAYAALLAILFLVDYNRPASDSSIILADRVVLYLLVLASMAALIVCMLDRRKTFGGAAATIFTLVYPALFMEFFYLALLHTRSVLVGLSPVPTPLTELAAGAAIATDSLAYCETLLALLILFLPPILSDTAAYFWGRTHGRVRIAPVISPKKTLEGSLAGVIGGAAAGLVVYIVGACCCAGQPWTLLGNVFLYILAGAVLAILSQFGDLAASYLKRAVGIKDYGRLLPGHGGVMDRIDSSLFIMPIVYLFVGPLQWVGIG